MVNTMIQRLTTLSLRLSTVLLSMLLLSTLLVSPYAFAENSSQFGNYTVYYNAFTSDTLQPSMARAYNITRSKNRGLLSVSILKKSLSPLGTPVRAKVEARATNMTGQLKNIAIREVKDGDSYYYLSEFHVSHREILNFVLNITPEGAKKSFTVKYRQQFFTQ